MDEPTYAYGTFISQVIPDECLHRLGHYRSHLLACADATGVPLVWTIDTARDFFLVETPVIAGDGADEQPIPIFFLGLRDQGFSVEFHRFEERVRHACNHFVFDYLYRKGVLRLPVSLGLDSQTAIDMVMDGVRAHCETKIMREDAEHGREEPSILSKFIMEIETVKMCTRSGDTGVR